MILSIAGGILLAFLVLVSLPLIGWLIRAAVVLGLLALLIWPWL